MLAQKVWLHIKVRTGPFLGKAKSKCEYLYLATQPLQHVDRLNSTATDQLGKQLYGPIGFSRMLEACSKVYGDEKGRGRLIHSKRWVKAYYLYPARQTNSTRRLTELDGYRLISDERSRIRFGRMLEAITRASE
jgi:hypothetical protein